MMINDEIRYIMLNDELTSIIHLQTVGINEMNFIFTIYFVKVIVPFQNIKTFVCEMTNFRIIPIRKILE